MKILNQLFSFLFSRQTLAFVAFVLVGLFVWFVGPLLGFNDLHPLASVGTRVSVIVLLLALAILVLLKGPVSLVGVAALCLLIWHGGPLLAVGTSRPLEPEWIRAAIVGALLLAVAIYWLVKLVHRMAVDKDFLSNILRRGDQKDSGGSIDEEVKTLNSAFERALKQLRKLRGRGGLRSILEGSRYLYDLPWYMVIGSPGAGKTSAVLNSGLQFPLGREANIAPQSTVLQYKMGTMHCDWWFTNDAVLLDTAGRFVVSEKSKDPLEWHAFLGILRKHRPRAPVNGVLMALGADELLQMSDDETVAHAEMLRDRLADLRQQLGIQFPVYVIVTKIDLLKGFEQYFSGLTTERRAQVWGFTLPLQGRQRKKADAMAMAEKREALRAQVQTEMDQLRRRLEAGMRARMVEQPEATTRKIMFALPEELSGMSVRLTRMLEEIFLDSRFDYTQANNGLRGVYLTSAAQVGESVLAMMSSAPADFSPYGDRDDVSSGKAKT